MGGSSAIRWIARAKIGELKPRPQGRCRASSLDVHETLIVGMIEKCKDITLNEMVTRLAAEQSMRISRNALGAWLRGHGWVRYVHARVRSLQMTWPRLMKIEPEKLASLWPPASP